MKSIKLNNYVIIAALVLVACLGFFVDNRYTVDILITTLYYTAIACAWNIMCGYAGSLSLGHVAFMGIGQYTTVLLFTKLGISPWIGLWAGVLLSMLLALFIGMLALRLKSFYFSLSTIAVTTILQIFAIKFSGLTGGAVGITVPYNLGFANMIFKESKVYYAMFVVLVAVILITTAYISKSKLGSNLIAIREDDVAASALGINIYRNKIYSLLISALFTSVAGSIYTMYTLFMDPYSAFNTVVSQKAAIITIIGGSGTVFGPLIGGLILGPMEIYLRTALGSTYQGAYLIIYGVVLVAVILYIPNGIYGTVKNRIARKKAAQKEAAAIAVEV